MEDPIEELTDMALAMGYGSIREALEDLERLQVEDLMRMQW